MGNYDIFLGTVALLPEVAMHLSILPVLTNLNWYVPRSILRLADFESFLSVCLCMQNIWKMGM